MLDLNKAQLKNSFINFAAGTKLAVGKEAHELAPTPNNVRGRNGVWDRLSHASTCSATRRV